MDKAEINYNDLKDKIKFKGNPKAEVPILALNAEIEELKDAATSTKTKYVVPGKFSDRSRKIPNWMKTPPKNGKTSNEAKINN